MDKASAMKPMKCKIRSIYDVQILITCILVGVIGTESLYHASQKNLPSNYYKIHSGMTLSEVQSLNLNLIGGGSLNIRLVTQIYQTPGNDSEIIQVRYKLDACGDYCVTFKEKTLIHDERFYVEQLLDTAISKIQFRFVSQDPQSIWNQ